jgi:glycosyltransferase involved in cell wall biosynthesis
LTVDGMRIALISEHASPLALLGSSDAGGQNVHVAELARGLAALGAEVVVHTRRDDPSLAAEVSFTPGVTVHHVDAGPAEPLPKDELLPFMGAFAEQLIERWAAERPHVVHSHFWMSGLAGLEATRRLDLPLLHTYHALGLVKKSQQGRKDTSPPGRLAIEARLAREADHIVATARDEARQLRRLGAGPERVTVIPCGVDLGRFSPVGPVAHPRTGAPRVVALSRFVERKGIGNAIEAVASLPGVELLIGGGPPAGLLEDDSEARRYQAMIDGLGATDRIRLLGAVARDDVPALLRSGDVVVCTPWYEPFGIVAVEAMACGLPVVASRVGGLAETVVDEGTGLLVPPRDPPALAGALTRMFDDPELRRRMGAAAVERSRTYGWDSIATRTAAVAEQVTARRSGLSTEGIR